MVGYRHCQAYRMHGVDTAAQVQSKKRRARLEGIKGRAIAAAQSRSKWEHSDGTRRTMAEAQRCGGMSQRHKANHQRSHRRER
jgi:hypothetical protein